MNNNRTLLVLIAVVIIAALSYGVLTMPDHRTPTEKVGDAIHDLPQGITPASRQLESRTPGQKLGDSIKDTGDKVKDDTAPHN